MRHIMVMNAKGGSGKTTIATNLASYFVSNGSKVGLVDLDPQAASLAWLAQRSAGRSEIQGIDGIKHSVRPSRGTDFVVIDTPAAVHGKALSDLVRRAETVIIPILPSPIDMRAATDFIAEVKALSKVAKKQAKIALVANRVREHTRIYGELEEFLRHRKIPFLTTLRDSQNYIRAAERGIGVFEMLPQRTAIDREQWAPIVKWIKSKRSQP